MGSLGGIEDRGNSAEDVGRILVLRENLEVQGEARVHGCREVSSGLRGHLSWHQLTVDEGLARL